MIRGRRKGDVLTKKESPFCSLLQEEEVLDW